VPEPEPLAKLHVDLPNHWATGGESLWARPVGPGLFELDNVPFYAYDLNFGDTVRATPDAPDLKPEIREVVRRSGHRTLRIIFTGLPRERQAELLDTLAPFGASAERATASFVALDIVPGGDVDRIRALLDEAEAQGLLEYETCEARVPGSFDDSPRGAG
jgi:hypothetical protein